MCNYGYDRASTSKVGQLFFFDQMFLGAGGAALAIRRTGPARLAFVRRGIALFAGVTSFACAGGAATAFRVACLPAPGSPVMGGARVRVCAGFFATGSRAGFFAANA